MQLFLERANQESDSEALMAIAAKRPLLLEAYNLVFEQVNPILLPAGTDIEKIRKIMDLVVKGLMAEKFRTGSFHPEQLYAETEEYLDMLKALVYRE